MSTLAPDRLRTNPVTDIHTPPEVVDVLRKARAFFDSPDKWLQRYYQNEDKSAMCLDRALYTFATNDYGVRFDQPYLTAQARVREATDARLGLVIWNDSNEREFDDILRALDTAIYNECHRS